MGSATRSIRACLKGEKTEKDGRGGDADIVMTASTGVPMSDKQISDERDGPMHR